MIQEKSVMILLFGFLFVSINYAQTAFYVSTVGDDGHSGNIKKPFVSITRAQAEARKIKGKVIVYLRGGTYYLKQPVIFTSADSRKSGEEIVYKAYAGEEVIISGAIPLQLTWKNFKNGIKQAKVSRDILFDQVFVNGTRLHMARYPNFNPESKYFGGTAANAISPERSALWKSPAGGFVHALHRHEWGDFHYAIIRKDLQDELILEGGFQNNRKLGMHPIHRFVENIFEELDTAGEWYYNKGDKTLYLYPPKGLNPENVNIEVPQLKHLFEFRGRETSPVKNITIDGLQFTHTLRTFMENREPLLRSDWTIYRGGAVVMEGTENCHIKNCFFNTVGSNALFFTNYNRYNEVSGNHIAFAGTSGICFVGDPNAVRSPSFEYNEFIALRNLDRTPGPNSNNFPAQCRVYDNLIHDIGQVEKQVAGVQVSMSQSITISHNTIYNLPRAGINISEGTWGGHLIEYNDVFNTVLETGDHGSFNSWGRDRYWHPNYDTLQNIVARHPSLILLDAVKTTIIRNNRFRCDHGWDIDLDDGSSNYHIYNNLCLNGGLKLREGFNRIVENNIIINNSFHPHVWFKNSGDVFVRNIVTRGYFPIRLNGWGKLVDYNLFPDSLALKEAQKNGTDMNSVYGSPDFINPSKGDFRVNTNSPASKIGFKNFPMDSFGVVSTALQRLAMTIPLPMIVENKESRDVRYEWMGLVIKNLTTLGERSATGMSSETGVLVLEVMTWSQFSDHLKPGDVILSYNKNKINDIGDLEKSHSQVSPNSTIGIMVFRDQKEKTINVKNR